MSGMEDPERRLRQLLAVQIGYRAQEAASRDTDAGPRHQLVSLVRLWQTAGEGRWDQPDAFGHFEHLMADVELGGIAPVLPSDEELAVAAHEVAEAARILS